jgi:hypothetical protein
MKVNRWTTFKTGEQGQVERWSTKAKIRDDSKERDGEWEMKSTRGPSDLLSISSPKHHD